MLPRPLPWSTPLTTTALALSCWAGGAHATMLVEATGGGYLSADHGATQLQIDVTRQTVAGTASASGQGDLRHSDGNGPAAGSLLSGSASASYGVLKARIDGRAYVFPEDTTVPIISRGTPMAVGSFGSRFIDSFELKSATLAAGTPVQYTFTVDIHVVSNQPGHQGPEAAGYDSGSFYFHYFMGNDVERVYHFPNGLYKSVPDMSFSLPVVVSGLVGDVLTIGAELGVSADDRAGIYWNGIGYFTYGLQQETHIDASNTMRFYLDAITPGLDIVSESGHNYAITAVPEPGTWALMAAGLCAVGWRRRRA